MATQHSDDCSYDVFLSFRGEDTRHTFTGSLYHALSLKGLKIFIDDDGLKGGDQISPSLLNAIQQSRISIVVLSENYASSTWCLDELVEILECMRSKKQLVWPIFYRVEPSHVRHQRYSYAEAMAEHEERFGDGSDKVEKWRSALSEVAGLKGWHYETGRYEYEFIEEIAKKASIKLQHEQLDVGEVIIGHQKSIDEVKSLLDLESYQTVCMLGIHGTGGIGKTTLAKALFNSIVTQFECAVFLENVRERSNSYMGLVHLQETILCKLFEGENIKLGSVSEGTTRLKHILRHRRVLLVLDDVDSEDQLEKLTGKCNWFGSGSRIIVTTRDKHVLDVHEVELRYEMKGLNFSEALNLFSWKAFKRSNPAMSYVGVSNRVVHYAGGLPLVLKVIGSHLAKKSVQECEGALEQYERIPEKNIQGILKISYDSLEDNAKNIFLDIACFFKGKKLQYVEKVMEKCEFFPSYNIGVLVDKSLIAIKNGYLWMHDLIQEMGKEILRQEAPLKPGERSRLYFHKDVLKTLRENLGSDKIEGIMLDPPQEEEVDWSGRAFEKMDNLRILIIRKTHFTREPSYLPNSIKVLEWEGYPSKSLPLNFHLNDIVDLSLPRNHLILENEKLFHQEMKYLTRINFSECDDLTHFPDVTGLVPNLRELDVSKCRNLIAIHPSVGSLKRLQRLDAYKCIKLQDIPPRMLLPALESINLYGTSIAFFPQIVKMMSEPLEIKLVECPLIKKLPDSITNLMGLEELYFGSIRGGLSVGGLPSGIFTLPNLKGLYLHNCGVEVRESFTRLLATTGDDGPSTSSSNKPPSLYSPLRELYLTHCGLRDEDLQIILCCFPNLEQLGVDGNEFVSLPSSIRGCSNLKYLDVSDCMNLEEIPQLPESMDIIYATGCPSLSSEAFNTLWSQALNEVPELKVVMSGTIEIPDWFDYCCEGGNLSFWVRQKFPGLAVAFILKEDAKFEDISLWINADHFDVFHDTAFKRGNAFYVDLRFLLIDGYQLPILETYLVHEWNYVTIECECYNDEEKCNVSNCGAYVYKRKTNMEDILFTDPNSSESTLSIVDDDDDLPQEEAQGGSSTLTIDVERITNDIGDPEDSALSYFQAGEASTSRFSHGCCGVLECLLKFTQNLCLGLLPFLHGRNSN